MSSHKCPTIRILEPPSGKPTYTSLRKANLEVASGDAYWDEGALRYYPVKSKSPMASSGRSLQEIGYDEVGQMGPKQLKGLHLTKPPGKGHGRIQVRGARCIVKAVISL